MDRRLFLKTMAAATGGLVLGDILGAHTASAAVPYKQRIVTYAINWARDGQRMRNAAYPSFPRNDCTNFASQALIAAGLSQDSGWWCRWQWWSGWGYSRSWINVDSFRSYHVDQKRTAGVGGVYDINDPTLYQKLYDRAEPGDMLQVLTTWGSGAHTMIITGKAGGVLALTYHSGADDLDRVNISLRTFHSRWMRDNPWSRYWLLKF